MLDQLAQSIPPTRYAASIARCSVERLRGRLDDEVLDNVKLLVSELVSNSVRHAGLQPDEPIELRVQRETDRLRVEVVDHGRGFTPPASCKPSIAESGMGLLLVDRIASRWGVERSDASRAWFEFDL